MRKQNIIASLVLSVDIKQIDTDLWVVFQRKILLRHHLFHLLELSKLYLKCKWIHSCMIMLHLQTSILHQHLAIKCRLVMRLIHELGVLLALIIVGGRILVQSVGHVLICFAKTTDHPEIRRKVGRIDLDRLGPWEGMRWMSMHTGSME